VVGDVGKRAFEFYSRPLRNCERLAESEVHVDGARTSDDTNPSVAETADRRQRRSRIAAYETGLTDSPARRGRTDERGGVDPLVRARIGERAVADTVRMLQSACV